MWRSRWPASPGCGPCRCRHDGYVAAPCPALVHAGRSGPVLGPPASIAWGPADVLYGSAAAQLCPTQVTRAAAAAEPVRGAGCRPRGRSPSPRPMEPQQPAGRTHRACAAPRSRNPPPASPRRSPPLAQAGRGGRRALRRRKEGNCSPLPGLLGVYLPQLVRGPACPSLGMSGRSRGGTRAIGEGKFPPTATSLQLVQWVEVVAGWARQWPRVSH